MLNKSYLTAISRTKLSSPVKNLVPYLQGRILDYGCGKGSDVSILQNKGYSIEGYDPYYFPQTVLSKYDTILCTYVLNVIPEEHIRESVLQHISGVLLGSVYITVRTDIMCLKGWTKRGTWQGLIELDLPVVFSNSKYRTYVLTK